MEFRAFIQEDKVPFFPREPNFLIILINTFYSFFFHHASVCVIWKHMPFELKTSFTRRAGQWCRYDGASPCGCRLIYDGSGLINGTEGQIPQSHIHPHCLTPNIPTTVGCRRRLIIVSCTVQFNHQSQSVFVCMCAAKGPKTTTAKTATQTSNKFCTEKIKLVSIRDV